MRSVTWISRERVEGIEPSPSDWKSEALPLCNTRMCTLSDAWGLGPIVSLAGIEPAAPDLGGLGLSFSRDVVHATGIEPVLLFRVMEALSHLAQRAWGERRDSNPPHEDHNFICLTTTLRPQCARRDSNPHEAFASPGSHPGVYPIPPLASVVSLSLTRGKNPMSAS